MLKVKSFTPRLRTVTGVTTAAKQFSTLPKRPVMTQRMTALQIPSSPWIKFLHRTVHSTSKKQTILLDLNNDLRAKYASMNCQGLRMELKKRGLRTSGRKLDLIQRLCQADGSRMAKGSKSTDSVRAFSTGKSAKDSLSMSEGKSPKRKHDHQNHTKEEEQTRSVSTSSPAFSKNDSSNIDFYKPVKEKSAAPEHIGVPSFKSKADTAAYKPKPKTVPKPESVIESKSKSEPVFKEKPKTEFVKARNEPSKSKPESVFKEKPKYKPVFKSKPKTEPDPVFKSKPKPNTKKAVEPVATKARADTIPRRSIPKMEVKAPDLKKDPVKPKVEPKVAKQEPKITKEVPKKEPKVTEEAPKVDEKPKAEEASKAEPLNAPVESPAGGSWTFWGLTGGAVALWWSRRKKDGRN